MAQDEQGKLNIEDAAALIERHGKGHPSFNPTCASCYDAARILDDEAASEYGSDPNELRADTPAQPRTKRT